MKKMVKIIAIILTLLTAFSGNIFAANAILSTEPQEDISSCFGDVNGDGRVSILDSAHVFFHVLGLRKLDEDALACADVNGDGEVTFDDMSEITQYAFNMIPAFSSDTRCWTIGFSESSNVFNGGSTEGGKYTQDKDENGNNIYLLYESYEKSGITEDSPIAARGVNIECNGNPEETQIMEISYGVGSDLIYAEALIKQWGSLKSVANMLRLRLISDNGKVTLVLPSINSYVTDLGEDFIDIDEFVSVGREFHHDPEEELEYVKTYYSHSLYVVRGGVKYICEIYKEPFYLNQYYFTPDGKLARTERIRTGNTEIYSITDYEYFGPELDENMFDIPAYYIEISLDDLKKFISNNSLAQVFFNK